MTKNRSFVVAIAQAKTDPWETIWREGQLPTWVGRYKEEYQIVNVSGLSLGKVWRRIDSIHEKNRYTEVVGKWQGRLDYIFVPWLKRNIPEWKSKGFSEIEEIEIQTNSSYIFAGRRLLGLINWFMKETSNEFMFITTTSSLINLKTLERTLMNYDANMPVYSGNLLGENGTGFISGAGQLINRKTAEIILRNFKAYPHRMLNDVALAHLLSSQGIKPEHKPWLWIRSVEEAHEVQLDRYSNVFHFRLKSETKPRVDHQIMKIIHDRLCEMSQKELLSY